MKREFLQNLKVGDTPLSKEVMDAIMEENGRDINAARAAAGKPFADYDAIKAENETLKAQLSEHFADGMTAAQWKQACQQAAAEHEKQLRGITFTYDLERSITALGGRNPKAITALLDVDTLQQQENPQEAIRQALQSLKKTDGYLFADQTPPPYAIGAGTRCGETETAPTSLAGALREKFERMN